jgi:hypothetical protein
VSHILPACHDQQVVTVCEPEAANDAVTLTVAVATAVAAAVVAAEVVAAAVVAAAAAR